jgi:hypothetical protein
MRTSIHSGGTGIIRHSPRNGFNGFLRALPGDEFLLPPSSRGLNGFTCPVGSTKPPRDLASATDARTTRLRRTLQRRSSSHVCRSLTGSSPALRSRFARNAAASTASRSNVRDDREAPLLRDGMAGVVNVIWGDREAIYFSREGWTGIRDRCPTGKSPGE